MSLNSTAAFGNAAITVTAIHKICGKINANLLLLQGLSNVMDASGNMADIAIGGAFNSVTLLDAIAHIIEYLRVRTWATIATTAGGIVSVTFKLPYNNSIQTSILLNIYKITFPYLMYRGASTAQALTSYTDATVGNDGSNTGVSPTWQVSNLNTNYISVPQTYITDLIAVQQAFENLNDIMTALDVMQS